MLEQQTLLFDSQFLALVAVLNRGKVLARGEQEAAAKR